MKNNMDNQKKLIISLYEESINDIIWTHKIHATLMDSLSKKKKILEITKEVIIGLSSLGSVIFMYFEVYIGALISTAITTLSLILDNIFKCLKYEERIVLTKYNVNELWYMKKELLYNKKYLEEDIVDWEFAKVKLEETLKHRKKIYAKLEDIPNNIIEQASEKLKIRKDEEVNNEFFSNKED